MARVWELVKAFGRFWYGFIIGDDWFAAAGVVVLIGGAYGLIRMGVFAWWYGPAVIAVTAGVTVRRQLLRNARRQC